MLYRPDQHEPLAARPWQEETARSAIAEIVAEAEEIFDQRTLWPRHPLDDEGPAAQLRILYDGAAGVIWALDELRRRGAAELRRDWASAAGRLHDAFRAHPDPTDLPGGIGAQSLYAGAAGPLYVAHRLGPERGLADELAEAVHANRDCPTWDWLYGSPGTMLAAQALHTATGDERWRALWLESADLLWAGWQRDEEVGCFLWRHLLVRPEPVSYYGAGHGFAGNVRALHLGAAWLTAERRAELVQRAVEATTLLALEQDGLVNWSPGPGIGPEQVRVQWCHGAPGMVLSLGDLAPADAAFAQLMVGACELIWQAGPIARGPSLCHGTAGNGYALLALHASTGDERWLQRARAFAMHAIGQVERAREAQGHGRYSLWTGDLGVALYLDSCLRGDPRMPSIDVL